ncbi:uncharacterized protein LOC132704569 [Cylas formicarius]|uniref:uncharacterized protein LOC132704569 n=1 Tax=Cylas formicarius TaxID=197179 RepID=UPI002958DE8A|nr:uncharacterized protein LOC132704569 [Cylas formicarius]XP_060530630.1 uncharacterized protein LOC132704569 [Cylas formicarius]
MRVVALISGGKDSTFNMMQCIACGHEIVALANLVPHSKSEIDSYMYQSVGHEAIDLIAQALDLPLFKKDTYGISKQREKTYEYCDNDEVEDLYKLLKEIKNELNFDAVSVGAILSDYQRLRVENVCIRLGLTPLAYLWQRNQKELLDEMIKCEVDAIVIKVAALGLEPIKHLGRTLSSMQPHLLTMHEKYGLNVCGEGGEYETLTLDCPLFKSRLLVEDSDIVMHSDDPVAPVGYLRLNKLSLEIKLPPLNLHSRLEGLPLKNYDEYVTDLDDEQFENSDNDADLEPNDEIPLNEPFYQLQSTLSQKPTSAISKEGWLWIGGIQGSSMDSCEAMRDTLSKLKNILAQHNHTVKDVCAITLFINEMSQFSKINELYIDTFNHINPPTRACVQVPSKVPVILEALSFKANSCEGDVERHTVHVQSISHWAPSSIGPYSQSVQIGMFIYLAGQIGLIPSNMRLVSGGIKAQCQLVLRHVRRLLRATSANVNLRDVVQSICYVTHSSYIEPARKLWEAKTNNAIVDYVVVSALPRNALVEWHVWAHKQNNQFEYEERGKRLDNYSISLYRRVNYENNVAAIVCRVEGTVPIEKFDGKIFFEALTYSLEKLQQGHENDASSVYNIKIFFRVTTVVDMEELVKIVESVTNKFILVYTLVPVLGLKNDHTFMSICGVRNQ